MAMLWRRRQRTASCQGRRTLQQALTMRVAIIVYFAFVLAFAGLLHQRKRINELETQMTQARIDLIDLQLHAIDVSDALGYAYTRQMGIGERLNKKLRYGRRKTKKTHKTREDKTNLPPSQGHQASQGPVRSSGLGS